MTEPMLPNETLQSQLSAFIDDELPTQETELLVRQLAREPELQQTMGRYMLMGEALRAPPHERGLSKDFSAKIAAAIAQDDEKQHQLTQPVAANARSMRRAASWLRPVAGLAIAASVALVAIVVVRSPTRDTAASLAQQALKPTTVETRLAAHAANSESYVVPAVANAPSAPIPAARLTNYVVAHSEFTTPLGQHNMLMGLLSGDQSGGETSAETTTNAVVATGNHSADPAAPENTDTAGQ